jgi:hypothetical protein
MNSPRPSASRIAYSFPAGCFDLRRLCPAHYFETNGGATVAVQLDRRWAALFKNLRETGLMMVSAAHGPLSMAVAWERPPFESYPGSLSWINLDTSAEISPAAIGNALAVVETVGDQQMASFQFFDRHGDGCMKILMTNWSDRDAFETIVLAHADERGPVFTTPRECLESSQVIPDVENVRALWHGLSRTFPDSNFPGLPGVTRHAALCVAGDDLAWQVPRWVVRHALSAMTSQGAAIGGAIRNNIVFLPIGYQPASWGEHDCGTTWYGEDAQITMRGCMQPGETWVTSFKRDDDESLCIEFFDRHKDFCGGIGLRPECDIWQYREWAEILVGGSSDHKN